MGLRERKKAITKDSLQQCAINLFREHGYETTTIEQIAEAAGVSRRTFFRYFPTKEDVVLHDEYDLRIVESFESQPLELGPIEALRRALQETLANMSESDRIAEQQRNKLIASVPELRMQVLSNITQMMSWLTQAVAKRTGCGPDDFATITIAGAIIGTMLSATLYSAEKSDGNYFELTDHALSILQAKLHI